MPSFRAHDDVLRLGVRVLAGVMVGVRNEEVPPGFGDAIDGMLAAARTRFGEGDAWKSDSVLAGFRELRARTGVSHRDFPSASESLVRRLVGKGALPRITPIVDLYNLVSVETGLALGAHDVGALSWPVELRYAREGDLFHSLDAVSGVAPSGREYVYADAVDVICRLDSRQSFRTLVRPGTQGVFFIVQGHAGCGWEHLESAWDRLVGLVQVWCGGEVAAVWRDAGEECGRVG